MRGTKSFLFLIFFVCFLALTTQTVSAQNTINGMIFDHNRRPVPDINVELLDDLERTIATRKTRGSGFYSFQRLNRGVYYVSVRVAGTNFKRKKVRIDLGDLNAIGGVDVKQVDVHLELDDRKTGRTPARTGVVFVQEVPSEAKLLFAKATKNLNDDSIEEAVSNLNAAVKIFPEYYQALIKLGTLHINLGKFADGEGFLTKAVNVNPKSFTGYYGIGIAQYKLKRMDEAIENLRKAIEIDPSAERTHLQLGIVQRELKRFEKAETSFLKAKRLSNNRSSDANWNLALLYYYNLKKKEKAADELDSFLKNLPKEDKKKNPQKVATVKKLIKKIRRKA